MESSSWVAQIRSEGKYGWYLYDEGKEWQCKHRWDITALPMVREKVLRKSVVLVLVLAGGRLARPLERLIAAAAAGVFRRGGRTTRVAVS